LKGLQNRFCNPFRYDTHWLYSDCHKYVPFGWQ